MQTSIENLGKAIEARINNLNKFDVEFPEIAAYEIEKHTSELNIDTRFITDLVIGSDLPSQVNLRSKFGQPPLTVFRSQKFYIEALFWFPSRTSIHGHGFCGAFKVLQGTSLQTTYNFHERISYDELLKAGDLELQNIQLLCPGDIFKIQPLERFVHCVVHLGSPSLTLVVRSYGLPSMRKFEQFRYFQSGLGVRKADEITFYLSRELDALLVLYHQKDSFFFEALAMYSEVGDEFRRFTLLEKICNKIDVDEDRARCRDIILAAVDPELRKIMENALDENKRSNSIWGNLGHFKDKSIYLDVALGELVGKKHQVNACLKKNYPNQNLEELLSNWRGKVSIGMQ